MKHTIYYYPALGDGDGAREFNENPLALDEVGFSPKPLLKWRNENQSFTQCPAYREWGRKTWVVEFPTDLEIGVNFERKSVGLSNPHWKQFMKMEDPHLWDSVNKPVFQFTTGYLFWTESKNIWMQVTGPQEAVWRNNFRTIEAQYPISVWTRSTNLAFQMGEIDRPISLKRGDPVMYLSFFSGGIKDTFVLEKKVPDQETINRKIRNGLLSILVPNLSWGIITKRSEQEVKESKCPFARAKRFFK
jgi:hypothetical protein